MAVLSWTASGLYHKMASDITTSVAWRPFFEDAFWTPKITLRDNEQLTLEYVFPSFILLGVGLVPAIAAFFLELLYNLYKKRDAIKISGSRQRHISKGHVAIDVTRSTKWSEEVEIQITFCSWLYRQINLSITEQGIPCNFNYIINVSDP